jgi:uncharacterized protein involved in exopolysaccharide biosynthesis
MMSKQDSTEERTATESTESSDRGIDLFAVTVTLVSEWRLGLVTWFVMCVVLTVLIFSLKPQYQATATLLPQEGRASGDNFLASLFTNHGPGPLYTGLLASRTVQEDVIERAHLMPIFHTTSLERAREILNEKSNFTVTPDSLVEITVRDGNAQDAARIANGYLDSLADLNKSMAVQQSLQTEEVFHSQLDHERQELATSEQTLAQTQKQTGLVSPEAQTSIGLNAIAAIRSEITNRQVQLTALLQGETEQNPQVETLRSQIARLQAQEHQMEQGVRSPVGAAPPAGEMPQTNLDILRAQREVKYHDALVNSLTSQFETMSLNEAFAQSAFQVVDRAVPPEHKAWPPRRPFFLAAVVFGAIVGLGAILAKLTWRRILADPEHQAELIKLRRAFGLG